MNTAVLIEALVRQTTVLIATLATAAGQRAPLSRVADQVFGDLVRVLSEQGVGHKVIADMFGLALRTYHERVSRLAASGTDQGRSLWEAVFSHIEEHGPVSRARLLHRFKNDDEATVRGVVRDLVESALVHQTGRGDETSYRAADPKEVFDRNRDPETLDRLIQVAVYRSGPVERSKLSGIVPIGDDALLDASLARLVAAREVREDATGPVPVYDCESCVIAFGDPAGWEAAVFDHYQALVTALVAKLRLGERRADLSDKIGGSTFVFRVRPDHPMASEVLGFLRAMREAGMGLRKRLDEYDESHPPPANGAVLRVVSYVGQSVQEEESDDRD
jgi:hypothetical protein